MPLLLSSIVNLSAKVVFPLLEGPAIQINLIVSIWSSIFWPSSQSILLCLFSQRFINSTTLSSLSLIFLLISLTVDNLTKEDHFCALINVSEKVGSSLNGGILPSYSLLGYWIKIPGA